MRTDDDIKHINVKEHMPNKLHTKSSQFTNEFIESLVIFDENSCSWTFHNEPISDTTFFHAIYLTRPKLETQKGVKISITPKTEELHRQ
jgi:hypothetical protein